MPTAAGVVVEKDSKYIFVQTDPRELDGRPGGVWVEVIPDHTTLSIRFRANIQSVT